MSQDESQYLDLNAEVSKPNGVQNTACSGASQQCDIRTEAADEEPIFVLGYN